jgi:hypothetical protein
MTGYIRRRNNLFRQCRGIWPNQVSGESFLGSEDCLSLNAARVLMETPPLSEAVGDSWKLFWPLQSDLVSWVYGLLTFQRQTSAVPE